MELAQKLRTEGLLHENEVLNELLGFEDMYIIQRTDMLNFSLDSVLLANFVSLVKGVETIVDFGTGNAPIPLLLTQRTQAQITGIEIQAEVADMAQRTVSVNGLEDQIRIIHDDLNRMPVHFASGEVDVVVSNPPFFKYEPTSNINKNDYLTIARHEVLANLDDIVKNAAYLLNNNGYFAMVHRPDRLIDIIDTFKKYKLEPKRMQLIYPKDGREAHMLLIEGRKNGRPGLRILPPFIVHEADGSYRPEVLAYFNRLEPENN
ncbi:MAG: tRNA1(Val) (adenine(37)-N6)-methyltransferase [Culicoidibacterales bacterium]